jgi:hypothetical protein
MKSRFNQTSRRKKPILKVDAGWLGDGSRQFVYGAYLGVALAPAATWNLHTRHQGNSAENSVSPC